MNADDIALPERFTLQLQFAESHPEIDVISGQVEIFSAEENAQQDTKDHQSWLNSRLSSDDIEKALFVANPLVDSSVLIRRELFRAIGNYRDLSWPEDYDFWLRTWMAGGKIAKVPETILRWRDHPTRLTRHDKRYRQKEFIKAKAWALSETLLREKPAYICGTGQVAEKLCSVLLTLGCSVLGFVAPDPRQVNHLQHPLPVFSYTELLQNCGDTLIIGAISAKGAGNKLRELFLSENLTEGADFIIAA